MTDKTHMVNFVIAIHEPIDATDDQENEAFNLAEQFAEDLEAELNNPDGWVRGTGWRCTLDV